jgi:hypothetical protein
VCFEDDISGKALPYSATLRAYCARVGAMIASGEPLRYLLLRPSGGWGNKLRAYLGAMKLALVMGRLLLVDLAWWDMAFAPPYAPFSVDDVQPHEIGRAATLGSLQLDDDLPAFAASLRDGSHLAALGRHGVLRLRYHSSFDDDLQANAEARYTLQLMRVPTERFAYAADVMPALMAQPAPALVAALAATKAQVGWDRYPLRVAVHWRTCVDCGPEHDERRLHNETDTIFECLTRTLVELHAARGLTPSQTLVYLATDDTSLRPLVRARLARLASVSWSHSVTTFVNSNYEDDPDALLPIFLDWWLLGEADFALASGTTFSMFATARTGVPGRVFTHATVPGPRCAWFM